MIKVSEYINDKKKFYTQLTVYSDAYYNTGEPLISDQEFDYLVSEYEKAFDEKYQYLGKSNNKKVTLPVYMGSLDKCKTEKALELFKKRNLVSVKTETPDDDDEDLESMDTRYVISIKLDGISVLWYTEGVRERLATRGDGTIGSDISHLIPYLNFGNAKKTTGMILRGELIIPIETFKTKWASQASNPRNFVAGLVNAKDINEEALGDLHFVVYYDYSPKTRDAGLTYSEMLRNLRSNSWNTVDHMIRDIKVDILTKILKTCQETCKYEMDGLVIQNDTLRQEKAGDNPKAACAFKIDKSGVTTTVTGVEWTQSRYSTYHPTVIYEPIIIDGVELSRASGINAKWIQDNNIGPGTKIEVIRSGDVIPKIISIIKATKAQMPDKDYKWKGVDVYTETQSQESLINKLVAFFDACDAKGLKEGTITKFVESGYDTIDKILALTQDQILQIEGFQIKSAQKIIQTLGLCTQKDSIKNRMIGSAMFKGLGDKKMTELLAQPDIVNYLISGVQPVAFIKSINTAGIKKNAEDVMNTLVAFKQTVDLTKFAHQQQQPAPRVQVAGDYLGQIICFTGFRDKNLKEYVEQRGGTVVDDVSSKTNILVVKDISSTSGKIKTAQKNGIQIISKDDFVRKTL
jgi:DNA ligase (NAD+)